MTAPTLERMKFWIIKPATGRNYIINPRFDPPDGKEDWAINATGVTLELSADEQRHGAYCMKVNPVTGVNSGAYYHRGLTVTKGSYCTFSADVKGVAGQTMSVFIATAAGVAKATTIFTATGYWQRESVSWLADETATDYRVYVYRPAVASTDPFYVDGVQFENTFVPTTLMHGYAEGCRWEGSARNSTTYRTGESGLGGVLLDISDYARILSVHGLGMGDWNQIMTKMTSGGDMYQTHIRKSRNFSMVLAYTGDNQGDLQANRKVIIDALRPDFMSGRADERRVIRYQGFDSNGNEATNPIDIVCVFQPSHTDTPSLPVFQKDVLNFTIPSGLLQGAYNDGAELDWEADFPAEFIVKRDKDGNWCKWTGSAYASLITGLNGYVYCMAEAPDGKIYVGGNFTDAGGVTNADYLARWNPISEAWEAVVAGINSYITCMAFDANGDLYIGGNFTDLGSAAGDRIVKITDLNGTPTVSALGTGVNGTPQTIAIDSNGNVYAGGLFTSAGGVANTNHIAKWNGTTWSALSTGLNSYVWSMDFSPSGNLIIGGEFTDTAYPYLCRWNGSSFSVLGTNTDLNEKVYALAFGATGWLYVGGAFTNAGGNAGADYIAKWSGSKWESLGTGTNATVTDIAINSGRVYAAGYFTTAGGLTLTDRVAVWSNGAWQPLDINLPGTAVAKTILPASDGSLYIGGAFSTKGEDPDENAECGIVSDRVYEIGVASASANTYPFMQVHGPGTLKSIANHSTGKTIAFNGLTLQAGEYANLLFDPLNLIFMSNWKGRGNLMRYIVASSDYGDFYLRPGRNALSLFMTGTDSNSGAWISWTPQFWGLDGALL